MAYNEDEYLQLSGIQHFRFCRRQWALIHIENLWAENVRTVDGELMHERAHDSGLREKRAGVIVTRDLAISSPTLGASGACDVVEFRKSADGIPLPGEEGRFRPYPVEYKHGSPDEADLWQLCAQVICLEEMLVTDIPQADIYYGALHVRKTYDIGQTLRDDVENAVSEMNSLMKRGHTPKVRPQKACRSCSLYDICQPGLSRRGSASEYVKGVLSEE